MFDFFKPVLEFFQFIVDMLTQLVQVVTATVSMFTALFKFLPPEIASLGVITIAVCVLYKILGREG